MPFGVEVRTAHTAVRRDRSATLGLRSSWHFPLVARRTALDSQRDCRSLSPFPLNHAALAAHTRKMARSGTPRQATVEAVQKQLLKYGLQTRNGYRCEGSVRTWQSPSAVLARPTCIVAAPYPRPRRVQIYCFRSSTPRFPVSSILRHFFSSSPHVVPVLRSLRRDVVLSPGFDGKDSQFSEQSHD